MGTALAKTSEILTPTKQESVEKPSSKKVKTATTLSGLKEPKKVTRKASKKSTKIVIANNQPETPVVEDNEPVDKAEWTDLENDMFNYVNKAYTDRGEDGISKNSCLKNYSNILAERVTANYSQFGELRSIDTSDANTFLQACGYTKQVNVMQTGSRGINDMGLMQNALVNSDRVVTSDVGFTRIQFDGFSKAWVLVLSTN